MYCDTKMTSITCVLNELLLWSHISSDHPIFFKTVAELSKKKLPEPVVERLLQINKNFKVMQQNAAMLKRAFQTGSVKPMPSSQQVVVLMERFMKYNEFVISFYPSLKEYGKNDPVWQELIEHVIHEQIFMQELMSDLHSQLDS